MLSYIFQHIVILFFDRLNIEEEIFTIKTGDDGLRRPKFEDAGNVRLYFFCGGSGKCTYHRSGLQAVYKFHDFQVTRPEILPPLRDTVSLIDRHHRNVDPLGEIYKIKAFQTLGSDIQDLVCTQHGVSVCP